MTFRLLGPLLWVTACSPAPTPMDAGSPDSDGGSAVADGGMNSDGGLHGGALTFTETFEGPAASLLSGGYAGWQVLHPERALSIDVGLTKPGWLVIIPVAQSQNAWFQDQYGPLVFREVSGNFAAMTRVRVVSKNNPAVAPSKGFNAGGFVIRDASGTHSGNEQWVMYNMGGQGGPSFNYGREIKKTRASNSDLFINPHFELESHLMVCRVGARFRFYVWSATGNGWVEERYFNAAMQGGNTLSTFTSAGTEVTPELVLPPSGQSTPLFFDHPHLPHTVQLGLMGHTWSGGADTRAEFDEVRVSWGPQSPADCLAAFADPTAG